VYKLIPTAPLDERITTPLVYIACNRVTVAFHPCFVQQLQCYLSHGGQCKNTASHEEGSTSVFMRHAHAGLRMAKKAKIETRFQQGGLGRS